jgi:hypothetical protein
MNYRGFFTIIFLILFSMLFVWLFSLAIPFVDLANSCEKFSLSPFECTSFIDHMVTQNEIEQNELYEMLKWQISYIRMVLPPCRPALLRCMCSNAFPLCQLEGNSTQIIYVCENVCGDLLAKECGGFINHTSLSFLQQMVNIETDPTKECFDPPIYDHIPATTCLPDGIRCCTGILKKNLYEECDLFCISPIDRDAERIIEITMVVVAWCSFAAAVIGGIPFILDNYAVAFPNHIPLFLIASGLLLSLSSTWGSYSGAFRLGSYTCDNTSATCVIQAFFIIFFSLMEMIYALWLCYRITYLCYSHVECVKDLFPLLQSNSKHIFLVHGSSIGIAFLIAISQIIIAEVTNVDKSIDTSPGGFCFISPNYHLSHFYILLVPYAIILLLLAFQLFMIFLRFKKTSIAFLTTQLRTIATTIYMFIFSINLMILVIILEAKHITFESQKKDIESSYFCAASQPENPNPSCQDSLQIISNQYAFFVLFIIFSSPLIITLFICLSYVETWQWWWDILRCKPFVPISIRLNPRLSLCSKSSSIRKVDTNM